MSTAVATRTAAPTNGTPANQTLLVPFEQRSVKYVPLGESEEIEVSVGMVKGFLAVKSKSGREPGNADIMQFMMLCKSRGLNPFVRDAYLLGYDNQDGTTSWSLIVAIQALRKRGEAHPAFDGCQRGVIVEVNGEIIEREGSLTLDGEKLIGGWANAYRKNNKIPYRETVKLSVYDTKRSRWGKDPGGMIAKVAEAAALRRAFPSDLAGLYVREEFGAEETQTRISEPRHSGMEGLRNTIAGVKSEPPREEEESPSPQKTEEPIEAPAPSDEELAANGLFDKGAANAQEN